MLGFIIDVCVQGMLYGIMSMGVMLSYKVLNISDLSVDGTFPLGIAVSAILIINGVNPWIALLVSFVAGCLAGMITGLLHTKLKITALLSGILVMTGLYTVNLMVAGGKSNLPLVKFDNIFTTTWLETMNAPGWLISNYQLFVMIGLTLLIKFLIDTLLKTRFGYLLQVTGDNQGLVTSLAHDVDTVKVIGLSLANGIVALSGGIAASVLRYFDISQGTGMVVLGLSSVILGTTLFGRLKLKNTSMVILGAFVYRFIIALALQYNMDPRFLKLATVIIFVGAILLNKSTSMKLFKKGEQS